jgi:hypothetical protein
MDEAAIERLRIAVRVLNLHEDRSEKVTEAEIETLKSYLGGDLANVAVEDIATAVIRRELNLEPANEDSGRTRRLRRSGAP